MEALFAIFSAFGLSASAGLNAYIPLLVVGVIAHYTDLYRTRPTIRYTGQPVDPDPAGHPADHRNAGRQNPRGQPPQ